MRHLRYIALLAVVGSALMVPATANAAPYLGSGEARQYIGRELHQNFDYLIETGTLRARCYRVKRNQMRCAIGFYDTDGDYWCGYAGVAEYRVNYSVRWDLDLC